MTDNTSTEGLKSAADFTKQVITLSTGVIALTVTFLDTIVDPGASAARDVPCTMFVGWVAFGIAIMAALMTLGAITGTLDAIDRKDNGLKLSAAQKTAFEASTNGQNIKLPAIAMSLCFMIGMALTIITGFLLVL